MNDELNKIFDKHHAIVLETLRERAHEIYSHLKDEHDIFFLDKEDISIEDANTIKENANLRSSFGERVILVSTNKFGREAQQALLKILEEPPVGTKMIFITPNSKTLSPTILSRVFRHKEENKNKFKNAEDFLVQKHTDRLKEAEFFLKDEEFNLIDFISQIEALVKSKNLSEGKNWREALIDLYESKKALQIPGTSKKQILEYLALTLPKI